MRSTKREVFRFIFWGAINTLSGYLIYVVLLRFFPYLIAYSIAYALGIFLSYFLNSKFVFDQELKLSKAIRYPLVYLMQFLLGATCLYLLVQLLRVNKFLAPFIVVMITIPVTFFLSRRVVKGKAEKG